MARKKGTRIEEASRKGIAHGSYNDPWKGAKKKEETLFNKLRKGTVPR